LIFDNFSFTSSTLLRYTTLLFCVVTPRRGQTRLQSQFLLSGNHGSRTSVSVTPSGASYFCRHTKTQSEHPESSVS